MDELLQGFTYEELSAAFAYNPLTGVVVRLGFRPGPVGTVDGKGYLHVSFHHKFIRLHRLGWFLVHRSTPPDGIDHEDRNKQNNVLKNLRPCTCKQNAGNSGMHKHNTSGLRGVSKNSRSGMWHAQIKLDGKQTYLGRFNAPEDAARCYDAAARKHFGAFATVNYVC
jgi:hypothetical protein